VATERNFLKEKKSVFFHTQKFCGIFVVCEKFHETVEVVGTPKWQKERVAVRQKVKVPG